jgi:hypothetical protein
LWEPGKADESYEDEKKLRAGRSYANEKKLRADSRTMSDYVCILKN